VFLELIGSLVLERLALARRETRLGQPDRAVALLGGSDAVIERPTLHCAKQGLGRVAATPMRLLATWIF